MAAYLGSIVHGWLWLGAHPDSMSGQIARVAVSLRPVCAGLISGNMNDYLFFLCRLLTLSFVLSLATGTARSIEVGLGGLSNRVDLVDLGAAGLAGAAAVQEADIKANFAKYIQTLKADIRNGRLGRLGDLTAALLKVRPNDPEVLLLRSVYLAATEQPTAASAHLNNAGAQMSESCLAACVRAMLLRQTGDYSEALAACRKALRLDAEHPYPWNVQGRVYWEMGRPTNAVESFRRALGLNPDFYPALANLGAVALAVGDSNSALQAYGRAIKIQPADASARFGLARAFNAAGDWSKAMDQLKEAIRINPRHVSALHELSELQLSAGQIDDAIASAKSLLAQGRPSANLLLADSFMQKNDFSQALRYLTNAPPDDPGRHYLQGYWWMAAGRLPEARSSMEQVLGLDSRHFGAYAARAVLKFQLGEKVDPAVELTNSWSPELGRLLAYIDGSIRAAKSDWAGAVERLTAAAELVRGFSMEGVEPATLSQAIGSERIGSVAMGSLLYLKRLDDPALRLLLAAVEANPHCLLANYWTGVVYLRKGDRPQALAHFESALRSAPRFVSALHTCGDLCSAAGNGEKAVAYYERAQAVKANPALALKLGVGYENLDRPIEAEKQYRALIDMAPGYFVGYNQLAWLLAKRGVKLDEALMLARQADKLQPGNASVLDTVGWILFLKRQYPEAVQALERASAINPSDPAIWYHVGAARHARNEKTGAKEALQKSLALSDRSEVAAAARELLAKIR